VKAASVRDAESRNPPFLAVFINRTLSQRNRDD